MAREHARIQVDIWSRDFTELGPEAQRLYFLLCSQKTINNAGVLPLQVSKWARGSKRTTVEDIQEALDELQRERYVFVDEDTEEALVRSFIRGDGIVKHKYMLKNALTVARQTESPVLRHALATELRRLHLPDADEVAAELESTPIPTPPEPHPDGIRVAFEPVSNGTREGTASECHSNAHGEGEGEGTSVSPGSTNVDGSSSSARSKSKTTRRGSRIPNDFAVTTEMVAWARERTPHVDGRLETEKFINYWSSKSGAGATKLDWVKTWKNWLLTAEQRTPRASPMNGYQSQTDANIAAFLSADRGPQLKALPGGAS